MARPRRFWRDVRLTALAESLALRHLLAAHGHLPPCAPTRWDHHT